jgi:membrane protein
VALALFSASKGTQALVKALNIAYTEDETRGFLKLRLLSLVLTLCIIVLVVVGVVALVAVGNVAVRHRGRRARQRRPLARARCAARPGVRPALPVLTGPGQPEWRWTTPGAVVGRRAHRARLPLLRLLQRQLRLGADGRLPRRRRRAAPLALPVAFAVLFGAEIDSELEHQTAEDTTQGPAKPLGDPRRPRMADTVAR